MDSFGWLIQLASSVCWFSWPIHQLSFALSPARAVSDRGSVDRVCDCDKSPNNPNNSQSLGKQVDYNL